MWKWCRFIDSLIVSTCTIVLLGAINYCLKSKFHLCQMQLHLEIEGVESEFFSKAVIIVPNIPYELSLASLYGRTKMRKYIVWSMRNSRMQHVLTINAPHMCYAKWGNKAQWTLHGKLSFVAIRGTVIKIFKIILFSILQWYWRWIQSVVQGFTKALPSLRSS